MASELNKREEKAQNGEDELWPGPLEAAIYKNVYHSKISLTLAHVRSIFPRVVPLTFQPNAAPRKVAAHHNRTKGSSSV